MAANFEKTLRAEIKKLAQRLALPETRAFAVWYAVRALRLSEQEAIEATSYDGGNDRGTDFFYVDDEWDRVVIMQWKYYASSTKTPGAGELTQLFHTVDELADAQSLRDDGRPDLAEAAEALDEARSRNYTIDLRFLYPGVKDRDRDKTPMRLIRQFNRTHADDQITAQLVDLDELQIVNEDYEGTANRVAAGKLTISDGGLLEQSGPFGSAYVATVTGGSLAALYKSHGTRLFAQNVRLFLGSRKGSVNAGINDTLSSGTDRGNFWAYNNGITIIASAVENNAANELELNEFSIVNGCQTTVSIAQAATAAADAVSVVAKVIVAQDPDLVERVIRFTNSQTPISVWDISARDKLQQRLKKEVSELKNPWFYALRRGEFEDLANKDAFGPWGQRRILEFPLAAQFLAAFRGRPVEAYKEKALLFSTHRHVVFPPDTTGADLLWAWAIGKASSRAVSDLQATLAVDELAVALFKRGARFFVTAIAAQLLRERNGGDFVSQVDVNLLFGKAMGERLQKYATVAAVYYVQSMRQLGATPEDVGTRIRRPDLNKELHQTVLSQMVLENLSPTTLNERLPLLPGIAKPTAAKKTSAKKK